MKKLLAVQKRIKAISKDSTNPFFKSKYFDINKLVDVVKPLLNDEGLIVLQPLTSVEGKPALSTIIIDTESGERLIESIVVLPENPDPQKMGSIITYFRRYSLQSLLFLQAEDDDANIASAPTAPKASTGAKGDCPKCGAPMVMSQKGKIYCSKKCWLGGSEPKLQKQADAPPTSTDEYDYKDDLPFN